MDEYHNQAVTTAGFVFEELKNENTSRTHYHDEPIPVTTPAIMPQTQEKKEINPKNYVSHKVRTCVSLLGISKPTISISHKITMDHTPYISYMIAGPLPQGK